MVSLSTKLIILLITFNKFLLYLAKHRSYINQGKGGDICRKNLGAIVLAFIAIKFCCKSS